MDPVNEAFLDAEAAKANSISYTDGESKTTPAATTTTTTTSTAVTSSTTTTSTTTSTSTSSSQFESKLESITVGEPELKGGRFDKYHVFRITTQPSTGAGVERRFTDFIWLRETLVKMYPGVFIPPLPPKKLLGLILGNKNDDFLAERRSDIHRWLNRLIEVGPFLMASVPVQAFLTKDKDFEATVKDINKQLTGQTDRDVLAMYQELFTGVMASTVGEKAVEEVEQLRAYLVLSEKTVTDLCNTSQSLAVAHSATVAELIKMQTVYTTLYDTEKAAKIEVITSNLQRDQPLTTQFNLWLEEEKSLAPFYHESLAQSFKYELQDIQAYLELVAHWQEVRVRKDKAVAKGNKWRDPKTPAPVKEKDEQAKQADLTKEKEETELLEALTKLILTSQIQSFWQSKVKAFRGAIKQFAKKQADTSKQLAEIWSKIESIADE